MQVSDGSHNWDISIRNSEGEESNLWTSSWDCGEDDEVESCQVVRDGYLKWTLDEGHYYNFALPDDTT